MTNTITLNNLGPGPTMKTPASSVGQSGLAATIICTISSGASLTYEIDVSNDGANWNIADSGIGVYGGGLLPASGLSSNINYALGGFTAYWRLNITSYTSGSVSAAYATPTTNVMV